MKSLHDLFVHDLEDAYYVENELLDALAELAEQTETDEIASALRDHRDETQEHVDRLEEVFEMLDKEPEREKCEGIDGLLKEHESFTEMDPDQTVLDLHNLVAGQKTERYEITAYENLALIAEQLGMDDASDLLEETLEEEEAALETLSSLAEEFDYEPIREATAAD